MLVLLSAFMPVSVACYSPSWLKSAFTRRKRSQVLDLQTPRRDITRTEQLGQTICPCCDGSYGKGGEKGTLLNLHSLTRGYSFSSTSSRIKRFFWHLLLFVGEYPLPWVPKFLSFFRHNVLGKAVIHFDNSIKWALEGETVKLISFPSQFWSTIIILIKRMKKFGEKRYIILFQTSVGGNNNNKTFIYLFLQQWLFIVYLGVILSWKKWS